MGFLNCARYRPTPTRAPLPPETATGGRRILILQRCANAPARSGATLTCRNALLTSILWKQDPFLCPELPRNPRIRVTVAVNTPASRHSESSASLCRCSPTYLPAPATLLVPAPSFLLRRSPGTERRRLTSPRCFKALLSFLYASSIPEFSPAPTSAGKPSRAIASSTPALSTLRRRPNMRVSCPRPCM